MKTPVRPEVTVAHRAHVTINLPVIEHALRCHLAFVLASPTVPPPKEFSAVDVDFNYASGQDTGSGHAEVNGATLTYVPGEYSVPNDSGYSELVKAARALLSMYTNRQGDSGKLFLPLARDLSAEEARIAWVRLARALGEETA